MSRFYEEEEKAERRVTPLSALKQVGILKALVVVAVILIILTGVDRFCFLNGKLPVFARKAIIESREVYNGIGYTVEFPEGEEPEWKWFYE